MEQNPPDLQPPQPFIKRYFLLAFVGLIFITLVLFVYYLYGWTARQKKGEVVFPAGINYLSPVGDKAEKLDIKRWGSEGKWTLAKGRIYPYSFSYPAEMKLMYFPNDPTDAVGWEADEKPAEQNILLLVESISYYDKGLVGKPKEFIENYWRFFSGLTGVKSVGDFVNKNDLRGYKVSFINRAGQTPNIDIFFVIPGDPDHLLHVANGLLPQDVFVKIVDSLEYGK